jgi:hypothetical protein
MPLNLSGDQITQQNQPLPRDLIFDKDQVFTANTQETYSSLSQNLLTLQSDVIFQHTYPIALELMKLSRYNGCS